MRGTSLVKTVGLQAFLAWQPAHAKGDLPVVQTVEQHDIFIHNSQQNITAPTQNEPLKAPLIPPLFHDLNVSEPHGQSWFVDVTNPVVKRPELQRAGINEGSQYLHYFLASVAILVFLLASHSMYEEWREEGREDEREAFKAELREILDRAKGGAKAVLELEGLQQFFRDPQNTKYIGKGNFHLSQAKAHLQNKRYKREVIELDRAAIWGNREAATRLLQIWDYITNPHIEPNPEFEPYRFLTTHLSKRDKWNIFNFYQRLHEEVITDRICLH